MQFDSALGVAVGNAQKAFVDPANDVELLEELAAKRLLVVLMRIALPAGKFPIPGEVGAVRAEGQKKRTVTLDNGGDDDYRAGLQNLKVPKFTVQITRTGELWNPGPLRYRCWIVIFTTNSPRLSLTSSSLTPR